MRGAGALAKTLRKKVSEFQCFKDAKHQSKKGLRQKEGTEFFLPLKARKEVSRCLFFLVK